MAGDRPDMWNMAAGHEPHVIYAAPLIDPIKDEGAPTAGDLPEPDDKRGEPAFTRHGDEDCPECCAPVGTRHIDGCSGQFHESAVGTAHEGEADR